MEPFDLLKELACELIAGCTDPDLLDFVCKLLAHESEN
jgi:hypothetical protein